MLKPRLPADVWVSLHAKTRFWGFLAWALALPGFGFLAVGFGEFLVTRAPGAPKYPVFGAVALFAGLALYCGGLAAYARHKGWPPAWGLLGLGCVIGLIVIFALPRRCRNCSRSCRSSAFDCPGCGAPI